MVDKKQQRLRSINCVTKLEKRSAEIRQTSRCNISYCLSGITHTKMRTFETFSLPIRSSCFLCYLFGCSSINWKLIANLVFFYNTARQRVYFYLKKFWYQVKQNSVKAACLKVVQASIEILR